LADEVYDAQLQIAMLHSLTPDDPPPPAQSTNTTSPTTPTPTTTTTGSPTSPPTTATTTPPPRRRLFGSQGDTLSNIDLAKLIVSNYNPDYMADGTGNKNKTLAFTDEENECSICWNEFECMDEIICLPCSR